MSHSCSINQIERHSTCRWNRLVVWATILLFTLPLKAGILDSEIITYQGQLLEESSPFTGTVNMDFRLYTDESGGSLVASQSIPSVPVSEGLFQVELLFGNQPYETGLWLEVEADNIVLTPRQRVAAVPLALHSLNGGDSFWDLSGGVLGYDGAVSIGTGVDNEALNVNGATVGVRSIGGGNGVLGESFTPTGIGVQGFAQGDGVNRGVFGYTLSEVGYGGYFGGVPGSRSYFGHQVGIGTDNPLAMLHVEGLGDASPQQALRVSVGDDEKFVVGNLGTSIYQNVFVDGTVAITSFATGGGIDVCRTSGSTGVLAACSSSGRYKTDIASLESTTTLIEQLRPVSYRWTESGEEDFGLVAEEVAEIEPRLVTYNPEGQVEGVKYRQLSALLIRALQEQHRDINRLQAEIQALTQQLDQSVNLTRHNQELSDRVDRLEAVLLQWQPVASND